MIRKFIEINNVGNFVEYRNASSYSWNGEFGKVNIIYAPNGSGKTTLSTILNSLSNNNPELIRLKKTINQKKEPYLKILIDGPQNILEYKDKEWNREFNNIEIFDVHFIEDFLFVSSIDDYYKSNNLLKLLLGNKGKDFFNKHRNRRKKRNALEDRIQSLERKSKKNRNEGELKTYKNQFKDINKEIEKLVSDYEEYANPLFQEYVNTTNKYLSRFTQNVRLHSLLNPIDPKSNQTLKPSLTLEIKGKLLRFKRPDLSKKFGNVKFTLSEGDKNAVALSFFLARLEIEGFKDKIVVFDDPLSSFDHNRKVSTIYLLSKIATESKQFFLLTHDIYFAKGISDKLKFTDVTNLKIERDENSSHIVHHDIEFETLSGYKKDLERIKNYSNSKKRSETEKREVIRCIRPILESLIKTKYYEYFSYNDWLGDIISKVQKSDNSSLSRLKKILPSLIELNDFTKQYHHGETDPSIVNENELDFYIQKLKSTLLDI